MEHLTIDEVLDFVSMTELNAESIRLSAAVNGHIRKCDRCLKLVQSFQLLYDEFSRLQLNGGFKAFAVDNMSRGGTKKPVVADAATTEMDGFR